LAPVPSRHHSKPSAMVLSDRSTSVGLS
jgi:hypothetical protein